MYVKAVGFLMKFYITYPNIAKVASDIVWLKKASMDTLE